MSQEKVNQEIERISAQDYSGTLEQGLGTKSSRILQPLLAGEPGDIILDEQWPRDLGGISPGGKAYSLFETARRRAIQRGVVWRRLSGEKRIKCLTPAEVVRYGAEDVRGIRRKAKRGQEKITPVDRSGLSRDDVAVLNATAIQLATIGQISSAKSTKLLNARPEPSTALLIEHVLSK